MLKSSKKEHSHANFFRHNSNPFFLEGAFLPFVEPVVTPDDYASLYSPSAMIIREYKKPTTIESKNPLQEDNAFEEQFHNLLDAFKKWGEKNFRDFSHHSLSHQIEKFKHLFFQPSYSFSLHDRDFGQFKRVLEELWFILNNTDYPLPRRKETFMAFCNALTACASGAPMRCMEIKEEYTKLNSLIGYLAKIRTDIIKNLARHYVLEKKISPNNEVHVYNAFFKYAKKIGFEPFGKKVDDIFTHLVGLDEEKGLNSDSATKRLYERARTDAQFQLEGFAKEFLLRYKTCLIDEVTDLFADAYHDLLGTIIKKSDWIVDNAAFLSAVNKLIREIFDDCLINFYDTKEEKSKLIFKFNREKFKVAFLVFCYHLPQEKQIFKSALWKKISLPNQEKNSPIFYCFENNYSLSWIEEAGDTIPIKEVKSDTLGRILNAFSVAELMQLFDSIKKQDFLFITNDKEWTEVIFYIHKVSQKNFIQNVILKEQKLSEFFLIELINKRISFNDIPTQPVDLKKDILFSAIEKNYSKIILAFIAKANSPAEHLLMINCLEKIILQDNVLLFFNCINVIFKNHIRIPHHFLFEHALQKRALRILQEVIFPHFVLPPFLKLHAFNQIIAAKDIEMARIFVVALQGDRVLLQESFSLAKQSQNPALLELFSPYFLDLKKVTDSKIERAPDVNDSPLSETKEEKKEHKKPASFRSSLA